MFIRSNNPKKLIILLEVLNQTVEISIARY